MIVVVRVGEEVDILVSNVLGVVLVVKRCGCGGSRCQ